MEIPKKCTKGYRFGFNGKEMDNEVSGGGNSYDYGFRIYNPRLGRFLSTDPLTSSFPYYTPYQYAGNKGGVPFITFRLAIFYISFIFNRFVPEEIQGRGHKIPSPFCFKSARGYSNRICKFYVFHSSLVTL
jgi:RHS repeat-associated protein